MATYGYELLDKDPADIAADIRRNPDTVTTLDAVTLTAMLGYAQDQDYPVYRACYEENHRRQPSAPVTRENLDKARGDLTELLGDLRHLPREDAYHRLHTIVTTLGAYTPESAICDHCKRVVGPNTDRAELLFPMTVGGVNGERLEACDRCTQDIGEAHFWARMEAEAAAKRSN